MACCGEGHEQPAGFHRPVAVQHHMGAVCRSRLRKRFRDGIRRQEAVVVADGVHVIDRPRARNVRAIERILTAGVDDAERGPAFLPGRRVPRVVEVH